MIEIDEQKTTEPQTTDDSATTQAAQTSTTTQAKQATSATAPAVMRTEELRVEQAAPRRLHRRLVALVAIAALVVIGLLLWRYTTQRGAGQPVPAPRTIALEQSSATNTTSAPTDETITLPPEKSCAWLISQACGSSGRSYEKDLARVRVGSGASVTSEAYAGRVWRGRVPVLEGLQVGERVVAQGSFMLRAEWLKLHPATTA